MLVTSVDFIRVDDDAHADQSMLVTYVIRLFYSVSLI